MRVPAQLSMSAKMRSEIEARAERNHRSPGQEMICLLEFALNYIPDSLYGGNGREVSSTHADSQPSTAQSFSAHVGAQPRTTGHSKARERSA